MRVITGELRGRKLFTPKSNNVRPTTDKVKEAIFDLIIPFINSGFVAMDVFAGTGGLGIEAISRGASKVFFSDSSRDSLSLVRQNIKLCGIEDKAILLSGDYKQNIARVHEKVDIFFLDPPYAAGYIIPSMEMIAKSDNLADNGIIVCEYDHHDELPADIDGFTMIKDRKYGATKVSIFQKIVEE